MNKDTATMAVKAITVATCVFGWFTTIHAIVIRSNWAQGLALFTSLLCAATYVCWHKLDEP